MSRRTLFQHEALEFQQHNRQWGTVALLQPVSTKLLSWFIIAAVVLIIAFLFLGQYARKETVVGYLTPTAGTSKIFAPRQGTIKEIHVREGDQVHDGQPLLTVETNQIAADGYDVNTMMLRTLDSQKDLLTRQIAAEEQRTNSERERLSALIQGLRTEISQLQAQIKTQSERVQVAESFVTSAAGLREKGYMTDIEFRKREVAVLEQKQSLESLRQQLAARENQLIDSEYSLRQLPTVMAGKIQPPPSSASRRSAATGLTSFGLRRPDACRPCRPGLANLPIRAACKWRSSQATARWRRSCSYRPEPSVSCSPVRKSGFCMKHSRINNSARTAVAWRMSRKRS